MAPNYSSFKAVQSNWLIVSYLWMCLNFLSITVWWEIWQGLWIGNFEKPWINVSMQFVVCNAVPTHVQYMYMYLHVGKLLCTNIWTSRYPTPEEVPYSPLCIWVVIPLLPGGRLSVLQCITTITWWWWYCYILFQVLVNFLPWLGFKCSYSVGLDCGIPSGAYTAINNEFWHAKLVLYF